MFKFVLITLILTLTNIAKANELNIYEIKLLKKLSLISSLYHEKTHYNKNDPRYQTVIGLIHQLEDDVNSKLKRKMVTVKPETLSQEFIHSEYFKKIQKLGYLKLLKEQTSQKAIRSPASIQLIEHVNFARKNK